MYLLKNQLSMNFIGEPLYRLIRCR